VFQGDDDFEAFRGLKMKRLLASFFFCFLIFRFTVAEAEWLYNKQPVTNSPFAKTDGEFGAMLVFTDKPDQLFEDWNKDTLEVHTDFVEKIQLNKTLLAAIIFSNCSADKKGKGNVTVDFTVLDPQGKVLTKKRGLEVWVNKTAPMYRDLELSVDHIAITIKDGQQTGFYTVKALVHDKIARKTLSLEHQFEVFE